MEDLSAKNQLNFHSLSRLLRRIFRIISSVAGGDDSSIHLAQLNRSLASASVVCLRAVCGNYIQSFQFISLMSREMYAAVLFNLR